jgi:SAM-dependent methyltransferase
MVLATAIMKCWEYQGVFRDFARRVFRRIDVLEVNEAGALSPHLRHIRGHVLASYPDIDMMRMPYNDASFDLVVHSDTLEHVPDPVKALAECKRVLRPGGFCAFTVPIIVGRLTASREGKPPSYHGRSGDMKGDYTVITEYGADAWTHVITAGFEECRIISLKFPSAQAMVAVKSRD